MKILVLGRREVNKITEDNISIPHDIISISTPGDKHIIYPENKFRQRMLQIFFDDLDPMKKIDEEEIEKKLKRKIILFDKNLAKTILDFINEDNFLLCQCDAGISRSAGVAAAISKIFNGDDQFFFKRYAPNRHVYNTILSYYFLKE